MHHFKNFKSFADASIDLSRRLTVLIGKNGSGKSNAIEGVELLAQLAHGRMLNEITDVGRGAGGFEVRGGLQGCGRANQSSFTLGFSKSDGEFGLNYIIQINTTPEPHVASESLDFSGPSGIHTLFKTVDPPHQTVPGILSVQTHIAQSLSGKQILAFPSDRAILSHYNTISPDPTLKHSVNKEEVELIQRVAQDAGRLISFTKDHVRASFVFDPNPKAMRSYERIGNRLLSRNGGNLSAALYALKKGDEQEKAALARILGWIRQLPEEPYKDFGFVTTALNDVLFGLKETRQGPLLDARVLSDGTLRCLAVLTALETVEQGSRIVIEEFDNGLHPSRVGVLTQAIWDCAHRRKLNVLVTTHNPATLDALTEEQLAGVVLCFWDKKQKASRLLPLLELPRADVLLERGHLGDLVTRRILEQHLAPGFEEHQKQTATDWLKALP